MVGAILLSPMAVAQCAAQSIALRTVAPGCNSGPVGCCMIPAAPTTVSASLDTTACRLELTVQALEGCCGVRVLVRVLVLGSRTTGVVVPAFGPQCVLWVSPTIVLSSATSDAFLLAIPPGITPLDFHVQAAAVAIEPFLPGPVPTLSPAYLVSLR
jgi:hypothetical protein